MKEYLYQLNGYLFCNNVVSECHCPIVGSTPDILYTHFGVLGEALKHFLVANHLEKHMKSLFMKSGSQRIKRQLQLI